MALVLRNAFSPRCLRPLLKCVKFRTLTSGIKSRRSAAVVACGTAVLRNRCYGQTRVIGFGHFHRTTEKKSKSASYFPLPFDHCPSCKFYPCRCKPFNDSGSPTSAPLSRSGDHCPPGGSNLHCGVCHACLLGSHCGSCPPRTPSLPSGLYERPTSYPSAAPCPFCSSCPSYSSGTPYGSCSSSDSCPPFPGPGGPCEPCPCGPNAPSFGPYYKPYCIRCDDNRCTEVYPHGSWPCGPCGPCSPFSYWCGPYPCPIPYPTPCLAPPSDGFVKDNKK